MKWRGGQARPVPVVTELCANTLVTIDLEPLDSNTERPVSGLPPHFYYTPRRATDGEIGVPYYPGNFELNYRFDLAPFVAPYPGSLYLDGGAGDVEYEATVSLVQCHAPILGPQYLTLREVASEVSIPRGAAAFTVSSDVTVRIVAAGEVVDLVCAAGQRQPISNWGASRGTMRAVAGTIQTLRFEVWL